jgi:hypothetical protein
MELVFQVMPVLADNIWFEPTHPGGTSFYAQVTLPGPAPAGGVTFSFSSSTPSVIVPATVLVPQGQNYGRIYIRSAAVSSNTPFTITATGPYNTVSKAGTLTP